MVISSYKSLSELHSNQNQLNLSLNGSLRTGVSVGQLSSLMLLRSKTSRSLSSFRFYSVPTWLGPPLSSVGHILWPSMDAPIIHIITLAPSLTVDLVWSSWHKSPLVLGTWQPSDNQLGPQPLRAPTIGQYVRANLLLPPQRLLHSLSQFRTPNT